MWFRLFYDLYINDGLLWGRHGVQPATFKARIVSSELQSLFTFINHEIPYSLGYTLTIAATHNGKASFPLRCAPSIRWIRAASSGEMFLSFANLEMFDRGWTLKWILASPSFYIFLTRKLDALVVSNGFVNREELVAIWNPFLDYKWKYTHL